MLPPHCGQIRLRIDDMTLALNSPGSVSSAGIVCSSRRLNNKTRLQGGCQLRYGKQRRICAN